MKAVFVEVFKVFANLLYKLCDSMLARKDLILLLSRQSNETSLDYQLLKEEFEQRGYSVVCLVGKLEKGRIASYVVRVLKEIKLLAECRACVLDGYDPVVSMLDLRCESLPPEQITRLRKAGLQECFPCEPVVIQLWHAFGSFKKFGYQAVGTQEGISAQDAHRFNMHKNYSWIISSGESCRVPFAEAFRYPVDRVLALGRPEQDVLRDETRCCLDVSRANKPVVLFAPTLRRSDSSTHPFRELYKTDDWRELESMAEVKWSFHPVELGVGNADETRKTLLACDYVITDYSSIVYEAYLLGKAVLFYTPDIDEYRVSPGLNDDPSLLCPSLLFRNTVDLMSALKQSISGERVITSTDLSSFANRGLSSNKRSGTRASEIAQFVLDRAGGNQGLGA